MTVCIARQNIFCFATFGQPSVAAVPTLTQCAFETIMHQLGARKHPEIKAYCVDRAWCDRRSKGSCRELSPGTRSNGLGMKGTNAVSEVAVMRRRPLLHGDGLAVDAVSDLSGKIAEVGIDSRRQPRNAVALNSGFGHT